MINSDMFHNFEHYMYRDICYNILCLYYICMRVCVCGIITSQPYIQLYCYRERERERITDTVLE